MSPATEHHAPPTGLSLYEQVCRLLDAEPDGRLPDRAYVLPRPPGTSGSPGDPPRRTHEERGERARQTLSALVAVENPPSRVDEAERRLQGQQLLPFHLFRAVQTLDGPDTARAAALGRQLVRRGRTSVGVTAGIALLERFGGTGDIPLLSTVGLVRDLTSSAVRALDNLDEGAAARLWLPLRLRGDLRALYAEPPPVEADFEAVRRWFGDLPAGRPPIGPTAARRLAEAVDLPGLLEAAPEDTRAAARAAQMLATITDRHGGDTEIRACSGAVRVYEALLGRVPALLLADPGAAPTLVALAVELRTGASVLLDWPAGRREELLERLAGQLRSALVSGTGGTSPPHRAWARRTLGRPLGPVPDDIPLHVEAAVPDPARPGAVETRIMLYGRPVVAELFGPGPAGDPSHLLDGGGLRATEEPREVRLAEAYCTEGCCGALYVTIRREGVEVVWDGWRGAERGATPPAYRFDASAYDAEIARAEEDRSWQWPAWRTARLIADGLRREAVRRALERWELCRPRAYTLEDRPDVVMVRFTHQPEAGGPWLHFALHVPDDGRPPEEAAETVLRGIGERDPKETATVCGGSPAYARALGYAWPERPSP
ncbi:hypothetical protein [Streptomyces sp. NPDC047999]|uniref:hypothetical protein n=1 Tax=Streptomyces sp. NPDC047999 TaxID=3365497 RepID=UPI00371BA571